MARTKAEIRAFLDSKVGHTCVDKSDARLNGQCVCLIKNLMEFLGVPNPYGARGNAKDAGDAYIAQGIGTAGRGWLTVCINRSMGGGYGHIWCDLLNEANYESNGVIPLVTTKNTRPVQQAQQFVNFDKWIIEEEEVKPTRQQVIDTFNMYLLKPPVDDKQINYYTAQDIRVLYSDVLGATKPNASEIASVFSKYMPGTKDSNRVPYYSSRSSKQLYSDVLGAVNTQRESFQKALQTTNDKLISTAAKADISDKLQSQVDTLTKQNQQLLADKQAAQATGAAFTQWIGGIFNGLKK